MLLEEARQRVVISNVYPQIEDGRFAIKRVQGDSVEVEADIISDGHSLIAVNLLHKVEGELRWEESEMFHLGNDRWQGSFHVSALGRYVYTIQAWIDHFLTWQMNLEKKFKAGQDIYTEIQIGLEMIKKALSQNHSKELEERYEAIHAAKSTEQAYALAIEKRLYTLMRDRVPNKQWVTQYIHTLPVVVDIPEANFSAWYEFFPRSCSPIPNVHGTLNDCIDWLPEIARMGFNVVYLPPIHPIGHTYRKGKNNQLQAGEDDPGSPWAIGSEEGGHQAIHPSLGTLEDFDRLIAAAKEHGIHIALDLAFQCSPDHPFLKEHPEWFIWRPDGTIQHAENPPKKYEDIVPLNFESENWKELWQELAKIVFFWIERGVRWFRVDNPHTKPFFFWEWLIEIVKRRYPEVVFLSEAFTRSKIMHWLAKLGFTQSYTYFTWRYTKTEIIDYVEELVRASQYFRPCFWPNTPDILPLNLQNANAAAFKIRYILAATLSPNYGIYGPPYERYENQAIPGTEEYIFAEKYEIKYWEPLENGMKELMIKINAIRRDNKALQEFKNIKFYEVDNDQILYFGKYSPDGTNALLIVINLDSFNTQTAFLPIPLKDLNLSAKDSFHIHELLEDRYQVSESKEIEVTLDPHEDQAFIFKITTALRRETNFDYFM